MIKDVFNKIIMLVKSECIYYRTQTSQSKPWSGTHKDNKKRGRPKNTWRRVLIFNLKEIGKTLRDT